MKILAVDTSGKFCSISILLNDSIRESINSNTPLSHSSELAVNVKKIVNKYDINISDLDGIAINIGPGSFTGLRIGVSFAKGLSLSCNVPLIAVNAFDILKTKIKSTNETFFSCIYSHKHYAYGIKYKNGKQSNPQLLDLNNNLNSPIYICGLDHENLYDNDIIRISFDSNDVMDFAEKYFDLNLKRDLNSVSPIYIDYVNAK